MTTGILNSSTLAMNLWSERRYPALRAVLLVIVGSALLIISAKIKVPFYPVPMTLQTFAVMAIAAAYGAPLAVATVLVYLAEGMFGLPVFTNTPPAIAGPAYFLGPTGGFLVGFVIAAMIVGLAADRGHDRSPVRLFLYMLVADIVIFALGFAWLSWFAQLSSGATGLGPAAAWTGGVLPFLLADLVKIALAACLIPAAWLLVNPKSDAI
jgi:biotin transport system substrate-specific component